MNPDFLKINVQEIIRNLCVSFKVPVSDMELLESLETEKASYVKYKKTNVRLSTTVMGDLRSNITKEIGFEQAEINDCCNNFSVFWM